MKVLYLIGLFFLVSMVECSLPRSGREYNFNRDFEAQIYPSIGGSNQNIQYKRDAQTRKELYDLEDELQDVQQQQKILKEKEKLIRLRLDQVSRRLHNDEVAFVSNDPDPYLDYIPIPVRKSQLSRSDRKGKQVENEKPIPLHYRTPSQTYKFPAPPPPPNEPLPPLPPITTIQTPIYKNKQANASTNSLNKFKNNLWSSLKKKN